MAKKHSIQSVPEQPTGTHSCNKSFNSGGVMRLPELESYISIKKSKIYADIAAGTFPKPIELGSAHAKGWLRSEIDAWLMKQIEKRDGK